MHKPYFIQRVLRNEGGSGHGIDSAFSFDYMGATEFEIGLFPALMEMREQLSVYTDEPIRIKDKNGHVAWYVGPENDEEVLAYVQNFLQDQASGRCELRFKEPTHVDRHYHPRGEQPASWAPIGWWAIDPKQPWILFAKKDDARTWIAKMANKPKGKGKGKGKKRK